MSTHPVKQWSVSKAQISTRMEGDTVVLNTESGRYFSLSEVGSTVWEALQQSPTTEALIEIVLNTYDVTAETATRDVDALLSELREAGLVTHS